MGKIQPFNNLAGNMFNIIKPYFKSYRNRAITNVDTVVLHWTSSPLLSESITKAKDGNVGYHFIIDRDGQVYQGSPLNKFVAHAGNSYGPRGIQLNSHSISIAFIIKSTKNPFTEEMYNSCVNLIKDVKISIPTLTYITGHHWVSPGRRYDPETLNWNKLMNKLGSGYKIWQTGYAPFPAGLKDCKCKDNPPQANGNCKESSGRCLDKDGYGYSERNLKTPKSDLSFNVDFNEK